MMEERSIILIEFKREAGFISSIPLSGGTERGLE
jgi:hypothetical protein